jgi:hypothetical protein
MKKLNFIPLNSNWIDVLTPFKNNHLQNFFGFLIAFVLLFASQHSFGRCNMDNSKDLLFFNTLPTATISGTTTLCQNGSAPVVTFTGANGTAPYTFSYTINGGATYTVSTVSGDSVTVAVPTTASGVFVYNLVGVQDSSSTTFQTQSGTATITITAGTIYYADVDGDGYGNPGVPSIALCTPPAGYISNNTDCNDTNASINPNQVEIAGDGVDNNCDGHIDEVGLKTSVVSYLCGTTLQSLYSLITVSPATGAIGYRYEISSGNPLVVLKTFDTTATSFKLSDAGIVPTYSTAYSIRVSVKTTQNGLSFYQGYGTACVVNTPIIPTTQLVSSACGITTTSLYAPLYCNAVTFATGYEFEVRNGGTTRTYDTTSNTFNLMLLTGGVVYSTTYTVRVAPFYNGVVQAFGASCTVTTPAIATTQLVSSVCGITTTSLYAPLYCNAVTFATAYKFEVSDGLTTRTYETTSNTFNLMQLTGGVGYSTTYTVRVAPFYNGVFQAYGASCTVTTPTIPTTQLASSACGITIASLYAPLNCNAVTLATGYKFEVYDGVTTRTYETSSSSFNLMQLTGGAAPSRTYTIRVAPFYNGQFQAYGPSCNVFTSALSTTQLIATQCGITLTWACNTLQANSVSFATGYRFEVTNGGTTRTYDAATNTFNLMQLPGGIAPSTTYAIRVAPLFNGVPQAYGSSCNVTTTASVITTVPKPTLTITPNCGNATITVSNFSGTLKWSDGVIGSNVRTVTTGTYTVNQTATNGCTSENSNSVIATPLVVPPIPMVIASNACGSSIITVATSSLSGVLNWSNGVVGSGNVGTVTSAGTYTVSQTATNGCVSASSSINAVPLVVPPVPEFVVNNTCGSSIITVATSSLSGVLNWSNGVVGSGNIGTVSSAGTYTVTQTATNGCTSASSSFIAEPLLVPPAPVLEIINTQQGISTIKATNIFGALNWNDGVSGNPRTVTAPGTYTVTQTTMNDCTSPISNAVNAIILAPVIDTIAPIISVCPNAQSAPANDDCEAILPNFITAVTASDNSTATTDLVVTQSPPAGTAVTMGVTNVIITVKDAANNSTTCSTIFTSN